MQKTGGWTNYSYFLVWCGKGFQLFILPLGGRQQPFSCVLGHFRHCDNRTNKQPCDPSASVLDQWKSTLLQFTNPIVFRQRESWGLVCRFVWLAQKIEAKFLSCWMPQKNSRGILTKSCSFAICIFKAVVSISRGFLTRSGSGRSCNSAILGKWEEMGLLGQGKASWKTLRALSCTIRTALHQGSGHLKLWLALRI